MVRLTIGLNDVQTCYLSLERAGHSGVCPVFEFLAIDVLDCTDELCLLQGTVTYHDGSIEHHCIFFKRDVDDCTAVDRHLDCLETE